METFTKRKEKFSGLEFKFCNLGMKPLEIYSEDGKSTDNNLPYLFTIPPNSSVFAYPTESQGQVLKPGRMLLSKFEKSGSATYAYKPYTIGGDDEIFYFGAITADSISDHSTSSASDIVSILFENRALVPCFIFYRGELIAKLNGYHPLKHKNTYSIRSDGNGKFFQLGGWIEIKMENGNSPSQYIQLTKKQITNVIVGDVLSRPFSHRDIPRPPQDKIQPTPLPKATDFSKVKIIAVRKAEDTGYWPIKDMPSIRIHNKTTRNLSFNGCIFVPAGQFVIYEGLNQEGIPNGFILKNEEKLFSDFQLIRAVTDVYVGV